MTKPDTMEIPKSTEDSYLFYDLHAVQENLLLSRMARATPPRSTLRGGTRHSGGAVFSRIRGAIRTSQATQKPPSVVRQLNAVTINKLVDQSTRRNTGNAGDPLKRAKSVSDLVAAAKRGFDAVSTKAKDLANVASASARKRSIAQTRKLNKDKPLAEVLKQEVEPFKGLRRRINTTRRISDVQRKAQVKDMYAQLYKKASDTFKAYLEKRLFLIRSTVSSGITTVRNKYFEKIAMVRNKRRDRVVNTSRNLSAIDSRAAAQRLGFIQQRLALAKRVFTTVKTKLESIANKLKTAIGDRIDTERKLNGQRKAYENQYSKLDSAIKGRASRYKKATDARIELSRIDSNLLTKRTSITTKQALRQAAVTAINQIKVRLNGLDLNKYNPFRKKSQDAEEQARKQRENATQSDTKRTTSESIRDIHSREITNAAARLKVAQNTKSTSLLTLRGRVTGNLTAADGGVSQFNLALSKAFDALQAAFQRRSKAGEQLTNKNTDIATVQGEKNGFDIGARRVQEQTARNTRDTDSTTRTTRFTRLSELWAKIPTIKKARDNASNEADTARPTLDADVNLNITRKTFISDSLNPMFIGIKLIAVPLRGILLTLSSRLFTSKSKADSDLADTIQSSSTTRKGGEDLANRKEAAETAKTTATKSKASVEGIRSNQMNRFKLFSTRFNIASFIFNRRNMLLFDSVVKMETVFGKLKGGKYDTVIQAKRTEAEVSLRSNSTQLGNRMSGKSKVNEGYETKNTVLNSFNTILSKLVPVRTKLDTDIPDQKAARTDINRLNEAETKASTSYKNKVNDAEKGIGRVSPQLLTKTTTVNAKRKLRNEIVNDILVGLRSLFGSVRNSRQTVRTTGNKVDSETARDAAIRENGSAVRSEGKRSTAAGDATGYSILRTGAIGRLSALVKKLNDASGTIRSKLRSMLTSADGSVGSVNTARGKSFLSRQNAESDLFTATAKLSKLTELLSRLRALLPGSRSRMSSAEAAEQPARRQRDTDSDALDVISTRRDQQGGQVPGKRGDADTAAKVAEGKRPSRDTDLPTRIIRRSDIQQTDIPITTTRRSGAFTLLNGLKTVLARVGGLLKTSLNGLSTKPKEIGDTTEIISGLQGRRTTATTKKRIAEGERGSRQARRPDAWNAFLGRIYKASALLSIFSARQRLIDIGKTIRSDLTTIMGRAGRIQLFDSSIIIQRGLATELLNSASKFLGSYSGRKSLLSGLRTKSSSLHTRSNTQLETGSTRRTTLESDLDIQRKNQENVNTIREQEVVQNTTYRSTGTKAISSIQYVLSGLQRKIPEANINRTKRVGFFSLLTISIQRLQNVRISRMSARPELDAGKSTDANTIASGHRQRAKTSELKRSDTAGNRSSFHGYVKSAMSRLSSLFTAKHQANTTTKARIDAQAKTADGGVARFFSALSSAFASRKKATEELNTATTRRAALITMLTGTRSKKGVAETKLPDLSTLETNRRLKRDQDSTEVSRLGTNLSTLGGNVPRNVSSRNISFEAANGVRPKPDSDLPRRVEGRGKADTSRTTFSGIRDLAMEVWKALTSQMSARFSSIKTTDATLQTTSTKIQDGTTAGTSLAIRHSETVSTRNGLNAILTGKRNTRPGRVNIFQSFFIRMGSALTILRVRGKLIEAAGTKLDATVTAGKSQRLPIRDAEINGKMLDAMNGGRRAAKSLGTHQKAAEAFATLKSRKAEQHDIANTQIKKGKEELDGDELSGCSMSGGGHTHSIQKGGGCRLAIRPRIKQQQEAQRFREVKLALEAQFLRNIDTDLFGPQKLDIDADLNKIDTDLFAPDAPTRVPDLDAISTDLFTRGPLELDAALGAIDPTLFGPPSPSRFRGDIATITAIRDGARSRATNAGKGAEAASSSIRQKGINLGILKKSRAERAKAAVDGMIGLSKVRAIKNAVEVDGHAVRSKGFESSAARERSSAKKSETNRESASTRRALSFSEIGKANARINGHKLSIQTARGKRALTIAGLISTADGGVQRVRSGLTSSVQARSKAKADLEAAESDLSRIDTDLFSNDAKQGSTRSRIADAEKNENAARSKANSSNTTLQSRSQRLNEQRTDLSLKRGEVDGAGKTLMDAFPDLDTSLFDLNRLTTRKNLQDAFPDIDPSLFNGPPRTPRTNLQNAFPDIDPSLFNGPPRTPRTNLQNAFPDLDPSLFNGPRRPTRTNLQNAFPDLDPTLFNVPRVTRLNLQEAFPLLDTSLFGDMTTRRGDLAKSIVAVKSIQQKARKKRKGQQESLDALSQTITKTLTKMESAAKDIDKNGSMIRFLKELRAARIATRAIGIENLNVRRPARAEAYGDYRGKFIRYHQGRAIHTARMKLSFGTTKFTLPESTFTRQQRKDPTLEFDQKIAEGNLTRGGHRLGFGMNRRGKQNDLFDTILNRHKRANSQLDIYTSRKRALDIDIPENKKRRTDIDDARTRQTDLAQGYRTAGKTAEQQLVTSLRKLAESLETMGTKKQRRAKAVSDIQLTNPRRLRVKARIDPNAPARNKQKSEGAERNASRVRGDSSISNGKRTRTIENIDRYKVEILGARARLSSLQGKKANAKQQHASNIINLADGGPRIQRGLESAFNSRRKAEIDLDAAIKTLNRIIGKLQSQDPILTGSRKRFKDAGDAEGRARKIRDSDADVRTKRGDSLNTKRGQLRKAREDADIADGNAKRARPKTPDLDGPGSKRKKAGTDAEAIKKQRAEAASNRRARRAEAEDIGTKKKRNSDDTDVNTKKKKDGEDQDAENQRRKREAEEEANAKRKKKDDAEGKRKKSNDLLGTLLRLLGLLMSLLLLALGPLGGWINKKPLTIEPECEGDTCEEEKEQPEPDCEADPSAKGCEEIDENDEDKGTSDGYRQGKIDGLAEGSKAGQEEVLGFFGISMADVDDERALKQKLQALTLELRKKLAELEEETKGITRKQFCSLLDNELKSDNIPLEEVYPACVSELPQEGGAITTNVNDPLDAPQTKYDEAYTRSYNKAYKLYLPVGTDLGKRLGVGYLKLNKIDGNRYTIFDDEYYKIVDPDSASPNMGGGGGTFSSLKRALDAFKKRRGARRGSTLTAGQSLLNGTKVKTISLRS